MSDSCCSLEFARGGVIDESSVTNSQIVNSTVQASTITASSIEMLASIDTASAVVIAEALAQRQLGRAAACQDLVQFMKKFKQ